MVAYKENEMNADLFLQLQRSKKIYDLAGVVIVVVLLLVKGVLIWINLDSRKFSNITNSSILNYGMWMQTIATLLLSMFFILMGLRKYEHKWTILECFHEIDDEFDKVFYAKLFHKQTRRYSL